MEVSDQLFTPVTSVLAKGDPGTNCIGGCVSPRAALDFILLLRGIKPRLLGRRICSLLALSTELFRLQRPIKIRRYFISVKEFF
jgi:hypothetical protein